MLGETPLESDPEGPAKVHPPDGGKELQKGEETHPVPDELVLCLARGWGAANDSAPDSTQGAESTQGSGCP